MSSSFDQFFTASITDSAFAKYLDSTLPPKERDAFTRELEAHEKALSEATKQLEALSGSFASNEAILAGNAAVPPAGLSPT